MSLIKVGWLDGHWAEVRCSNCGKLCFVEESHIISDMALHGVVPLCSDCDTENTDTLPAHLYFLDETFLLGIDNASFVATWLTDDLEIRQEDLSCVRVPHATWYFLKTGRVACAGKRPVGGLVVGLEGNCEQS